MDKNSANAIKNTVNGLIDGLLEKNVPVNEEGKKVYPKKTKGGRFGGYDSLSDFVTVKVPPFGLAMAFASNIITYILFAATMREQWWPNADRFRAKGEWAMWFISVGLEPNPALIFIYLLITLWGESFTVKYIIRLSRYIASAQKMRNNPEMNEDRDVVHAFLAAQYWLLRNIVWVIPAVVVTCLDLAASIVDMTSGATSPLAWVAMFVMAIIMVFSGEVFFAMQQDGRETVENGKDVMDLLRAKEEDLYVGA